MGGNVSALVEMRAICYLLSIRTAALKVSFLIVVVHHQPFRAVTLVGGLVKDVAILTITLSSNLVKPGTRRAVGRGRWLSGVSGVSGCLGSVSGFCGSVGRCLVRALIEMRSIVHILFVRAATLKVSFSVIVSHFQPIGAVTLVGCPVNHVAVLTVTFLSILVQCGARWALVRHIGALVEMRSIVQIVSVRAGALKVSFSVIVSHFQPLGAVTLVGCPVNHVAVLTVTFLSNVIQRGASGAVVIRSGLGVGN